MRFSSCRRRRHAFQMVGERVIFVRDVCGLPAARVDERDDHPSERLAHWKQYPVPLCLAVEEKKRSQGHKVLQCGDHCLSDESAQNVGFPDVEMSFAGHHVHFSVGRTWHQTHEELQTLSDHFKILVAPIDSHCQRSVVTLIIECLVLRVAIISKRSIRRRKNKK